ncbi:UTRA domain-containing protein [Nonomuraea sp. NPDC023979]|uniref:UTRA domain-containing protein n=1 Tax=Nonomuraea sp. NPDC023979 TaxID=3154796 RepID=UPI0033FDB654
MDLRSLNEAARITDPIERARALDQLMKSDQMLTEQAAQYKRHAIAEARSRGMTLEQIAVRLGVTPGRIAQVSKGPAARAPEPMAVKAPRILVQRALPTDPATRGSVSLFLVEAERQGIEATREMLYIGLEPVPEHVAACLRVEPGTEHVARRKLMKANGVPVRIATSFFRADLFGQTRMAQAEFVRPTLQAALEDLGYRFGHAEETLTARYATQFEAETLELDPQDRIVVQVLRASYSAEGTPVHILETICAASRHVFPIGQVAGHDEF